MLTPERRDELADLLEDDKHFRTSYPAVADYLDTAPMLKGTDDAAADQAFDLRMLHFMAGGESRNPLWDIVGPLARVDAETARRVIHGSSRLAYAQTVLQEAFAYAVPSPETVSWVVDRVESRGVVEIGAGRGYWANQLRAGGLDVLAFDSQPPDRHDNPSFSRQPEASAVWGHVGDLDELAAADAAGALKNRVLFLCWPPGWDDAMSLDALLAYERADGDRVIYIGEPRGGRTGSEDFFDRLSSTWELVDEDPHFVTWWNLSDQAQCWSRRK